MTSGCMKHKPADADTEWPNARRDDDGVLSEAISLKLLANHKPEEGEIALTISEISRLGEQNSVPRVSGTIERFFKSRLGLNLPSFCTIDRDDVDTRITERSKFNVGPKHRDWDLSEDSVYADIGFPAVGDELVVVYEPSGPTPPKEVVGIVTDATPMRTEDNLNYWLIKVGTSVGTTIEVDTRRQGTPVKEIHADDDTEIIGDLTLVRHHADEGDESDLTSD